MVGVLMFLKYFSKAAQILIRRKTMGKRHWISENERGGSYITRSTKGARRKGKDE
jgi:hypothetical protein